MTMPAKLSAMILVLATVWLVPVADAANPPKAPPPKATAPSTNQDLSAVIALNGQPCGQVVSVQRLGDNDYVATCSDGNRYHVFVSGGRVVVQKQ